MERISASVAGSAIRLVEPVELALRRPIGLHRLDHGSELGELARELHEGLGRQRGSEIALERRVAGQKRVEFLVGKHGYRIVVPSRRALTSRDGK